MPFVKITRGKNKGKFRSPSGRTFTSNQVKRYHARGGTFDAVIIPFRPGVTYSPAKAQRLHDARPVRDPTGTSDIRRRNRRMLDARWRRFSAELRGQVVTQDILGLQPGQPTTLNMALSGLPTEVKSKAFQTLVDNMLARIVLEGQADYLDPMITQSYGRALARAQRMTRQRVVPPNMNDVIGNLQQLTFMELQGIVEAVSQRIVRIAASAQLDNLTPRNAFVEMQIVVSTVGVNRSRAMVEVMVVKTHAQATLDTFQAAGLERVVLVPETVPRQRLRDAVEPAPIRRGTSRTTISRIGREERRVERAFEATNVEVLTAGDDLVCPECEEIAADGPYTIDAARALIPAHPNCRCTFVAEGSEEFGVVAEGEDE